MKQFSFIALIQLWIRTLDIDFKTKKTVKAKITNHIMGGRGESRQTLSF